MLNNSKVSKADWCFEAMITAFFGILSIIIFAFDDVTTISDKAFISAEQAEKLKNVVVEKDDVLLNITGASVCRATLVDNSIIPARVNQHVCILRADTNRIKPSFLVSGRIAIFNGANTAGIFNTTLLSPFSNSSSLNE